MNETGEVIFDAYQSGTIYRRHLARPDGTVVDLGEAIGKVHLIDGAWYESDAGQLLAVTPDAATRSILSEGATGTFFTTDVAILNPNNTDVPVTIRYLRENAPETRGDAHAAGACRARRFTRMTSRASKAPASPPSSKRPPRRRSSSNA